ncbi:MAG TPA: protein kinase, partial [Thermoanaerobaculia bacterium]|nr:protein kinase [Thermoanaerobaculia bacterium]
MIGTVVSHYEILERLGGGGMGVVYRARDLRLGRSVALKFLSPRLSASPSHKQRLLREARAAASLEHPGVCTIYEADETADGQLFLAMAFCEGETLRHRLERGPLHPVQAVDYALQIAAGLGAAHAKGIVHRDVKPANILITPGGRLKIVDFGVAQLEDQTRLTKPGTVVGTAAYMSPEQLRGETVDHRTDLWSLGAVLYEMVSGRLPFGGATDQEIVRAIFTLDPEPLAGYRGDTLVADLDAVVGRALAKRPGERYQNAEQLAAALRTLPLDATLPTLIEEATRVEGFTPTLPPALPAPGATGAIGARGAGGDTPGSPGSTGSDNRPTEISPAGVTVGQFQVGEPLGGGGMGVVYKAEDTRLGRTVALKFLPPALSLDPEAKQRFLQEARAASALEHPNVCTIHEVGETADGRLYLAMPCYDGETLRQRIARGPLPVAEAADIAEQIARGLGKAHRQGIVHRDVKPANLMVTADGVVKILDFGIATLTGSAATPDAHAGTPSYMSPEQARGEEVDARTDLWSLGVVLYEMLAGHRPFRGEHPQAVRYAHAHEEPPPLAEVRPEAPAELARIVSRLLAKQRDERYPDAAAVVADLRTLRGETTAETVVRQVAAPPRRWLWAAVVTGAAGLVALIVYLALRPPSVEPIRADFTRLTDLDGSETFPSLSPGGDLFLYTKADGGDLDLFLRRVEGGEATNLTAGSPADDTQPSFSPDGRHIAFRSEREGGGLYVMSTTGGGVRRLAENGYNPAWSPTGDALLYATEGVADPVVRRSNSQIWRVELATGASAQVMVDGDAVQPSWSPSGGRIAYWGLPQGKARRVIWTAAADGSRPVQVTNDDFLNWNPVWSRDGRYLYYASDRTGSMNLWRVPIDERTGDLRGEPQAVTVSSSPSALLSLSRDGRQIVYAADDRRSNLERVAFDAATARAAGAPVAITQGARLVRSGELSPDGKSLTFYASTPREDLFLIGADGSGQRQLTDDLFKDRHPRWSPDGQRILFYSNRSGKYEAWSVDVADGRLEQLSRIPDAAVTDPLWSPDGKRIACSLGSQRAVLLDPALPLGKRLVGELPPLPGGEVFVPVSWSPDGRWLAGSVQRPGAVPLPGLVLHDLTTRGYRRLTAGGAEPVWLS